jgi:Brp/Blh family beta-carotene 15,15'-monooxygenase
MRSPINIFIFLNLVLLLFTGVISDLSVTNQLYISAVLIGFVGLPHGAIDHILFMQNTRAKPLFFYSFYLALIGFVIAIWLWSPFMGLILFLVLSAYHFGQSQFSGNKILSKHTRTVLYLSWGISVLSGLTVYNNEEILDMFSTSPDLRELLLVFQLPIQIYILVLSSLTFLAVYIFNKDAFSNKKFFIELCLFILIHISFYFQTILIGFSIYFVTIHSLEVLKQEYAYLKLNRVNFNFTYFLGILAPYTLVSIAGFLLILGLSHFGVLPISKTLVVVISISAFTLPHSLVMEKFYSSVIAKD